MSNSLEASSPAQLLSEKLQQPIQPPLELAGQTKAAAPADIAAALATSALAADATPSPAADLGPEPKLDRRLAAHSSLSAEQRSERAQKAALAKADSKFDWLDCSLEEGLQHLAELRAEADKGGQLLQQRMDADRVSSVQCSNPNCTNGENGGPKVIDVGSGRFAGMKTINAAATGKPKTAYACSAGCWLWVSNNFRH